MYNTSEEQKNMNEEVKEELSKQIYPRNEILKRLIYIQHKSNLSKFAEELGVSRQYIWGIISGRLKPSPSMARKISDALGFDTRVIFPDGSIDYPDFKTASEFQEEQDENE